MRQYGMEQGWGKILGVVNTMCTKRYSGDGFVYGEGDAYVSPLDDDYEYRRSEQDALTDPLSDDYCKYDNE